MGKMKSNENATTLAKNIRALRIYYGESQKDLAEIINCTPHAISQYELDSEDNSERHIPTADTLKKLAQHFDVTVYQLEYFDYEYLSNPEKDAISFYQNIDIVFPIVCTDRALKDKSFNTAYQSHLALYNRLKSTKDYNSISDNLEWVDKEFCEIKNKYQEAIKHDAIKPETSINILACCSFDLYFLSIFQIILSESKHNHALITYFKKRCPELDHYIKNLSTDEHQEFVSYINERIDELKKEINILRTASKAKYPDLIYYHLALQYIFGFADSDMELAYNRQIGIEMMRAFKSVGNKYAANYIDF